MTIKVNLYLTNLLILKVEENIFYGNHSDLIVYLLLATLLTALLVVVSYLLSPKNTDFEKSSAYECGFDSSDDARKTFDIHFYIVGVLFLIFDLEIAFLFPWAMFLPSLGFFGFFLMIFFLTILTIGFAYEWSKGALDWSSNKTVK